MKRGQRNCVFLPVPSLRNIRKHQEVAEGRPSAGGHRRTPDRLDADKAAKLKSLGASNRAAEWIHQFIQQNGPVLEQWRVDPGAADLVRCLHHGAWIQIRNGTKYIRSLTGGRQGCKLGATVFNAGYTVPLGMLYRRLADANVILRLRMPDGVY